MEQPTRERVLECIRRHISENGFPPTIREIMDDLHLRSMASVQYHLRRLERDGLIRRSPKQARGMALAGEKPDGAGEAT
jgi:repressor LexA